MKILALASVLLFARRANALGSLSECLSGEDAEITDISTIDWTAAYRLKLDPGDSCHHTTFTTSYAWWQANQDITVKTQNYRHPVGSETECQPAEDNLDYYAGTRLYTSQSQWPYSEQNICAHLYVFTNNDQSNPQTVELFTNGALAMAGSTIAAALLSATFLF